MLVLSRKAGETIDITLEDGRKISVMLVEIRGDKCRIGIDAAKTITVNRSEIQALDDAKPKPS